MKEVLFNLIRFLAGFGLVALVIYGRYRSLQSQVKDLGDGGITTIFGDRKQK